ncbi:MAG: type II secretion system ATPase GspE [Gammaproteobacteria bacterium]|nr:type II secretion system ATPase GspE [Gammaproteobacteria bacterium]NIR90073.1 type II secretion system ATPase GspE [Gammaproteobacteria bacterium]NIU03277.1 type II secretion system ATPase GspE [Gammaproteobacteria bacterium]NIV50771.1 type II secretion system ATPase GspE [Gammaproteobacteria bacterium]NIV75357.1 type II secretion system ATPase GspE [Gammaproteobacteria bacterium]
MQGSSGQDEGVNLAERLEALLLQRGKLRAGDVARVKHVQREQGEEQPFTRLLVRLGMVGERDIAEVLSELFSVPLAKPDDYADVNVLNGELSQRFLREHLVVPIQVNGDQVTLAMAEPQDEATRRAIAFATGKTILPWVGVYSEIENAIERMSGDQRSKMGQILEEVGADEDFSEEDVAQLKDLASEAPVIRLVNLLIQRATEAGASDIHIEPFEGQLKVRVRVDGILQDIEAPPAHLGTAVISRVKIMARLNIAERRLPQDGRIRLRMQGKDLDIRVSTVPTLYGESVVLRLLNQQNVALDFKLLGFPADTRKSLSEALAAPHGMILVTGPTGSGKTTTLYAALRILNTHERKILTVEDPVEYQLEGINQIQVKPDIGLTFANALRSILRQDPDVIMVGEMRDLETARICVQSALTGHLVLSTLHTNDAASSVTRLLEMGVEDYLLTSTLNAVLAQRLVRVLCDCRVPYEAMPELIEQLKLRRFTPEGPVVLHRPAGCDACNGTGYRGRTIIQELMVLDDELRRLVLREADAGQLHDAAVAAGMRTMYQDGLRKAVEGITTIEETVRVTQEM